MFIREAEDVFTVTYLTGNSFGQHPRQRAGRPFLRVGVILQETREQGPNPERTGNLGPEN